ncbi:hypothetical protein OG613_38430 [Streptomyces sp. NBC_00015]
MHVWILKDEPEPGTVVAAQPQSAGFATPARSVAVADLKMGA